MDRYKNYKNDTRTLQCQVKFLLTILLKKYWKLFPSARRHASLLTNTLLAACRSSAGEMDDTASYFSQIVLTARIILCTLSFNMSDE